MRGECAAAERGQNPLGWVAFRARRGRAGPEVSTAKRLRRHERGQTQRTGDRVLHLSISSEQHLRTPSPVKRSENQYTQRGARHASGPPRIVGPGTPLAAVACVANCGPEARNLPAR
jgi:hypothetical protein